LTKVAEKIIAEGNSDALWERMAELEEENSRIRASTAELQKSVDSSSEAVTSLRQVLEHGINDYELLKKGNQILSAERDAFRDRVAGLASELAEDKKSATRDIAALKEKVMSV
jgi:hypothetical protein